jgi:hypothetical protein
MHNLMGARVTTPVEKHGESKAGELDYSAKSLGSYSIYQADMPATALCRSCLPLATKLGMVLDMMFVAL